jgi:hypothetical protein
MRGHLSITGIAPARTAGSPFHLGSQERFRITTELCTSISLRLRQTLIAHHDTSVVKAQLSHMTLTNPQEGKPPLIVQTEGKVKALNAIAKKEIAEHYLKHMAASVAYLYEATQDSLGTLHKLRVLYPNLGMEKMKSLSLEFERLGGDTFRLPFANPKPIDEPTFIFPPSSYIWLEYTQTFYEVGPLPANGEPMVEVLDLQKPSLPNPTALNPYGKRSGG